MIRCSSTSATEGLDSHRAAHRPDLRPHLSGERGWRSVVARTQYRNAHPDHGRGRLVRLGSIMPADTGIIVLNLAGHSGRSAAFLVLLGFLGSFLFIRTSTRMIRAQVSWWPGNLETASGLHIHHLVWGIALMTVGGFLGFALRPGAPWYQLAAIGFGIGVGLTADEFALWVRLEDVYWSKDGRASLDAMRRGRPLHPEIRFGYDQRVRIHGAHDQRPHPLPATVGSRHRQAVRHRDDDPGRRVVLPLRGPRVPRAGHPGELLGGGCASSRSRSWTRTGSTCTSCSRAR